jgi:signal transduction histidine kinase
VQRSGSAQLGVRELFPNPAPAVGIGLSISRSIIDDHGGRLWAEANEPRGAVFQFTLPSGRELMNFIR